MAKVLSESGRTFACSKIEQNIEKRIIYPPSFKAVSAEPATALSRTVNRSSCLLGEPVVFEGRKDSFFEK